MPSRKGYLHLLPGIAVAVMSGITVAVIVLALVLQPYMAVQAASLETIRYDEFVFRDVQFSLLVEAHNKNYPSTATFSRLEYRLQFVGETVAVVRADVPLHVPARTNMQLWYLASARDVPLGHAELTALEAALHDGAILFEVEVEARTQYKFARLVNINTWKRLKCHIQFFVPNATALGFTCTPKKPPLF